MAGKRTARLGEQFKREIAELLRTQVRDPRIGTVTVTDVQLTADLGVARVYVLTSGDDQARAASHAGLSAAAPFLRSALGRILTIRRIPELRFVEDRSLEHAQRIERVLAEVLPPQPPSDADASAGADAATEPESE